jgi:hypothetical protein
MRNPLRRAGISFVFTLLGIGLLFLGIALYEPFSQVAGGICGVLGLTVAIVSFFVCIWALVSVPGYNRLRAGKGVIARWHLSAAEWDRFRALDKIRAAQHSDLRNDLWIGKHTPPGGVEVIVGEKQVMVDGSYHRVHRFVPNGRLINWLAGNPECIEFPASYPRGRSGGSVDLTLRIPVAPTARADGVRVFEHYKALGPQPRKA